MTDFDNTTLAKPNFSTYQKLQFLKIYRNLVLKPWAKVEKSTQEQLKPHDNKIILLC